MLLGGRNVNRSSNVAITPNVTTLNEAAYGRPAVGGIEAVLFKRMLLGAAGFRAVASVALTKRTKKGGVRWLNYSP